MFVIIFLENNFAANKTEIAMKPKKADSKVEKSRDLNGKIRKRSAAASKMPVRIEPTEEEIRSKAEEIYQRRVEAGEFGTPEGDWITAEETLRHQVLEA